MQLAIPLTSSDTPGCFFKTFFVSWNPINLHLSTLLGEVYHQTKNISLISGIPVQWILWVLYEIVVGENYRFF